MNKLTVKIRKSHLRDGSEHPLVRAMSAARTRSTQALHARMSITPYLLAFDGRSYRPSAHTTQWLRRWEQGRVFHNVRRAQPATLMFEQVA